MATKLVAISQWKRRNPHQSPESLIEKYKPRRLDDFIGMEKPKRIMQTFVEHPKQVDNESALQ